MNNQYEINNIKTKIESEQESQRLTQESLWSLEYGKNDLTRIPTPPASHPEGFN